MTEPKTQTIRREIAFPIVVSKEVHEEYRRILRDRENLDKAEKALIEMVERDDRIKPARMLSGYLSPQVTIKPRHEMSWTVTFTVLETVANDAPKPDPTPFAARPAYVNLPERTINMLLSGKILTPAEKRALIERLAPGVLSAPEGQAE
jgi:hypothetical protein